MEYHVSKKDSDDQCGSAEFPFRTIGAAAHIAQEGDTITVHEGIYREWVRPVHGGTGESRRIVTVRRPERKR